MLFSLLSFLLRSFVVLLISAQKFPFAFLLERESKCVSKMKQPSWKMWAFSASCKENFEVVGQSESFFCG